MKCISAIVREEKVPFIQKALEKEGIFGMTLKGVMGRGEQRGIALQYRAGIFAVDLLPKVRIDVVVPGYLEEAAVKAITTQAFTGRPGDGRIFVIDVPQSIRIRTSEVEA
ncbi:MAG TPA: P-II family nitrogen regulator [Methanolinea sp.]|nr:MAG: putative nitrogen regulatory PII-like protein [Methanoregulaceae archaeon PtaU1.Bin066]HII77160.1 P-II family nitrogen regulator [Methanolinea sp.]HNQ28629.1 P-II family nitrogen regulator [Methanolinea sp.]HNS82537.1 P-II family nitrogen regulator [Methanolinea sp.]